VDATLLASKLKSEEGVLVLSPQPNATAILRNVEGAREALNLNDEWEKLDNGCEYVTGVVVARTEFIEQNPTLVENFLKEYAESVAYASTDTAGTAALVSEFKILELPTPVIQAAIPASNIRYIGGEEMKTVMGGFIDLLFDASPEKFGGKKPDDGFYYIAD
jgi:NitT/TauT family transport system substrate-binding protein